MSWLLENWFGSKESLEQVREDIHEYLQPEVYLGVSGIEQPEASHNRVPSKELKLTLGGPWVSNLQEVETELLQLIHEELPPVVRDEVGVLPFFSHMVKSGFMVLVFVRNAASRSIVLNKLPLSLATPDGKIVATRAFDLLAQGPIPPFSSRPVELLFRWEDFLAMPEEDVQLQVVYRRPRKKPDKSDVTEHNGLTAQEREEFAPLAEQHPDAAGKVNLEVLGIKPVDDGGMKVVVLFQNGLDKRLEFTEVPIQIRDKTGDLVARVRFGLKNLHVEPGESFLWGFYVPDHMLKKENVNPAECTAYIPEPQQEDGEQRDNRPNGLVQ